MPTTSPNTNITYSWNSAPRSSYEIGDSLYMLVERSEPAGQDQLRKTDWYLTLNGERVMQEVSTDTLAYLSGRGDVEGVQNDWLYGTIFRGVGEVTIGIEEEGGFTALEQTATVEYTDDPLNDVPGLPTEPSYVGPPTPDLITRTSCSIADSTIAPGEKTSTTATWRNDHPVAVSLTVTLVRNGAESKQITETVPAGDNIETVFEGIGSPQEVEIEIDQQIVAVDPV